MVAARDGRDTGSPAWWAARGYVYARACCRGTGASGGIWRLLDAAEQDDLYDTIEWLAAQPWCSGRVGMIGGGGYDEAQWLAAAQQPPHLACIAPCDAAVDLYRDLLHPGGLDAAAQLDDQSRTLRAGQAGQRWVVASFPDERGAAVDGQEYEQRSAYPRFHRMQTPFCAFARWTGAGRLRGTLLAFEQVQAPKRLLIGGPSDPVAGDETLAELERWYAHWLKGVDSGILREPPVRLLVQNEGYRAELEWPLRRTVYAPLYLHAAAAREQEPFTGGGLCRQPPGRDVAPATRLGILPDAAACSGNGWFDRRRSRRGESQDGGGVAVFTSAPLDHDTEVTGPISLSLWASSQETDAGFAVGVLDRGLSALPQDRLVSRGWLRASHRALDPERSTAERPYHLHRRPEPLTPNRAYRFDVEIWPASYVFQRGHRIVLEIAAIDPNCGRGGHPRARPAGAVTLHHDAAHPSQLLLPLVPRAGYNPAVF